ncbi:MAG: hypothetical protein RAP41_03815 [Candidatus Orphnella occulta]|nr:hypothetical protein [Candidatus Orphnella occulta]
MANKKILVIEDEHELVQVLQIRLEAAGYDVLAAYDGQEGLTENKRKPYASI